VRAFLGAEARAGAAATRGALTVRVIPFMPQTDYDRLLWACDLNFVRGEDSWVRAQWAARPFIWHIYPQDENLHHVKLRAFLQKYAVNTQSLVDFPCTGMARGKGDMDGTVDVPASRTAAIGAAPAVGSADVGKRRFSEQSAEFRPVALVGGRKITWYDARLLQLLFWLNNSYETRKRNSCRQHHHGRCQAFHRAAL
jgi:hypothetical protein